MWSESSSHSVVSSSSVATSSMDDPLVVVADGDPSRRRWITVDWEPDEEELLAVLSRLMPEGAEPDPFDNRNRIKGLCFLLLFVLCAAVCALSHPAAGVLPQEIYFPFLGISLLPLWAAVYFFIRHHRGE